MISAKEALSIAKGNTKEFENALGRTENLITEEAGKGSTMAERLTKENFWNSLYERHPDKMKAFCAWIDEYKKNACWEELFGNVFPTSKKIKFHDIPLAMQFGIFVQYSFEVNPRFDYRLKTFNLTEVQLCIENWFEKLSK